MYCLTYDVRRASLEVTCGVTGEAVMPEPVHDANAAAAEVRGATGASGARSGPGGAGPVIGVRADGDRVVVAVRGDLDLDAADRLERALGRALGAAPSGVDLDLGGVAFCDCSALNVLLGLRERGLREGKTIRVRTAGPAVDRLLDLTGTRTLFDVPVDPDVLHDLRVEVARLRRAMRTRPVIDLARGILMATYGLGADEAWRVLALAARSAGAPVHRLAGEVVRGVRGGAPADAVRDRVAAAVAAVRSEAAPVPADGGDDRADG